MRSARLAKLLIVMVLLGDSSLWANWQPAPQQVSCPPKEPNSFCILPGPPVSYHGASNIAFSPDGQWLAIQWSRSYEDKKAPIIWVWKVATGQLTAQLQPPAEEEWGMVRFSPDGKLLASLTGEAVRIWEVGTWKEAHTLHFDGIGSNALAFSPNARLMASATCLQRQDYICTQPVVIMWDPYKGREVRRITQAHKDFIIDLAFLSDEVLVTASLWFIQFWQVTTGRLIYFIYPIPGGVSNLEISPNGKLLVAQEFYSRSIMIWEVSGPQSRKLGFIQGNFIDLSFTPDGRFLAGSVVELLQQNILKLQIWGIKESIKDWQVARTLDIAVPSAIHYNLDRLSFSPSGELLAILIGNFVDSEEYLQLWYTGDLRFKN